MYCNNKTNDVPFCTTFYHVAIAFFVLKLIVSPDKMYIMFRCLGGLSIYIYTLESLASLIHRPCTIMYVLVLTGSQSGLRDLDLTVGLVGLEGRGCTQLTREGLGTLGASGAGTGSITSIVRILLFIYCYKLARKEKSRVSLVEDFYPSSMFCPAVTYD